MSTKKKNQKENDMRQRLSDLYSSMDEKGRARATRDLGDIKLARELRAAGVAS